VTNNRAFERAHCELHARAVSVEQPALVRSVDGHTDPVNSRFGEGSKATSYPVHHHLLAPTFGIDSTLYSRPSGHGRVGVWNRPRTSSARRVWSTATWPYPPSRSHTNSPVSEVLSAPHPLKKKKKVQKTSAHERMGATLRGRVDRHHRIGIRENSWATKYYLVGTLGRNYPYRQNTLEGSRCSLLRPQSSH